MTDTPTASAKGRFDPLSPAHFMVGKPCVLCDLPLEAGQRPSLVHLWPADAEEAAKAAAGEAHNVQAGPAHETCVYPEERQSCSNCGGPHAFDTVVESSAWNEVVRGGGPEHDNELLCLLCVIEAFRKAERRLVAAIVGGGGMAGTVVVDLS